jgi:hypothetical protein
MEMQQLEDPWEFCLVLQPEQVFLHSEVPGLPVCPSETECIWAKPNNSVVLC